MASIDPTPEEISPSYWLPVDLAAVRMLGIVPANDLTEFLRDWKIDGQDATPAHRAQAAFVASGARVASGTQRTIADTRAAAAEALAAASAASAAPAASYAPAVSSTAPAAEPASSSGAPPVSCSGKNNGKSSLKLSAVLDQTADEDFQLMTRSEVDDCFKFYVTRLGGSLPDDQQPTVAQLSALKHVVTRECVPYADFGVFGPHAIRMMRKLRLTGLMLGPSGELFRSEMAGPMSYDQWEACFMVFRSAMVMLEFASPSSLDGYRDHVRQYSTRFRAQCWALIYQTDTRARREHAERLRRRANIELTALDSIGANGAYSSSYPWEYVFRQLPVEFAFWKRELENPALLIVARAPVAAITSEAPVAKSRDQHITQVAGDVPLSGLTRQEQPTKTSAS